MTACPWCGRLVGVVLDGRVARHDNRNNSGFCKGSLCPVEAEDSGSFTQEDPSDLPT